jgi:hypothetical protein
MRLPLLREGVMASRRGYSKVYINPVIHADELTCSLPFSHLSPPPSSSFPHSAFATGGLLGDTFLNLIPHSFMGEPLPGSGINVMVVEPKRNIIISLALFGGFASFFLLDKVGSSHMHKAYGEARSY